MLNDNNIKKARIKMACEKCVFAQFEDDRQCGCDIGRLNLFQQHNRVEFDDTTNSFVIDGVCNTCRGKNWADKHLGQNLIAVVEREIQVPFDFIIVSHNDSADKIMKQMPEQVFLCTKQTKIHPRKIICVVKNNEVSYQQLYNTLIDLTDTMDIEFKLVHVLEEDADFNRCLSMGVQRCSSTYFGCFDLNDNIPSNLINIFNTRINHELKKISMVVPYQGLCGLILQTSLFKLYNGKFEEGTIIDVIKVKAQEQELENQIITWEQLWNYQ